MVDYSPPRCGVQIVHWQTPPTGNPPGTRALLHAMASRQARGQSVTNVTCLLRKLLVRFRPLPAQPFFLLFCALSFLKSEIDICVASISSSRFWFAIFNRRLLISECEKTW